MICCFRYHKGTDFQANHNMFPAPHGNPYVVLDTTKVQIFKQITTFMSILKFISGCFRYHKGTDFQANHNQLLTLHRLHRVVLDTTKVQIFKQITTKYGLINPLTNVVLDTTKVQIFKQITTFCPCSSSCVWLF